MAKKKWFSWSDFVSYLLIAVGALMASFSVVCILIPNDAIDYGTAGIAIVINKLTGINFIILGRII